MKFTCEKVILESAINTASRAVANLSSIPAITGLLLETTSNQELRITGYNMKTGIRTTIPITTIEEGSLVLNAKLLSEIIRRLPDNIVTLSSDDRMTVNLTCGNIDYNLLGMPASDFPELPQLENNQQSISIQQKQLQKVIQETSFAISIKENRPIYTGALFEINRQSLTVVTVDGFRLAIRREPLAEPASSFSFVVPGTALSDVEKICKPTEDLVLITLGERSIQFQIQNTELICRKLEGEFLDYHNTIPKNNPIQLTVDPKALITCIERVSVVISDKNKTPLRCKFEQNQVTISAQTAEGNARDICPLDGNGSGLEIGFNNRYLLEALRYAPANKVRIQMNTNISPALITPIDDSDNFLYMVLPVRMKASD